MDGVKRVKREGGKDISMSLLFLLLQIARAPLFHVPWLDDIEQPRNLPYLHDRPNPQPVGEGVHANVWGTVDRVAPALQPAD